MQMERFIFPHYQRILDEWAPAILEVIRRDGFSETPRLEPLHEIIETEIEQLTKPTATGRERYRLACPYYMEAQENERAEKARLAEEAESYGNTMHAWLVWFGVSTLILPLLGLIGLIISAVAASGVFWYWGRKSEQRSVKQGSKEKIRKVKRVPPLLLASGLVLFSANSSYADRCNCDYQKCVDFVSGSELALKGISGIKKSTHPTHGEFSSIVLFLEEAVCLRGKIHTAG